MLKILPFHGAHFDWRRVALQQALCPPYDVIPDVMARKLRKNKKNTIQVELPAGGEGRFKAAARAWERWKKSGDVVKDLIPAFYVIEQKFKLGGKTWTRSGFLSSLRLDPVSLSHVIPHEKTLAKPKQDRLKMLDALRVQTSPIFALYGDSDGKVRKILAKTTAQKPEAQGVAPDGVTVRVWRLTDPEAQRAIERAFEEKKLLIADGHHRLEVSKNFGAGGILCYLCAEEDRGLAVLPTHRVLADAKEALLRLPRLCRLTPFKSLSALERAVDRNGSPFAFGVALSRSMAKGFAGRLLLAVPSKASGAGVKSGLGVEWLAQNLFSAEDREIMRYTHESREAVEWADEAGAAFLVKPVGVKDIRRAVDSIGLLPQKSTYFFPKIEAGIVFQEIR